MSNPSQRYLNFTILATLYGMVDKAAGFLRVLRLPLPILIPPAAQYSLIIQLSTLQNRVLQPFSTHSTDLWSWAVLKEKPNLQHFMEPEGSLPCSQESSTGPYPEPDQPNPYHPIPSYLSKIYFSIVHPPTRWSSQWFLSFWLSHQYPIYIPRLPHSCYMLCPPHSPWLDHSI
jgi:hypothetical protein